MFVVAALVILASAEPFADVLVHSGQALGIDQFLLVPWLAPLSSEAPELIIAMFFALRGKGAAALGLLVSAKVNQWTLLVGSLPVASLAGGGSTSLVLDPRQVEEFALTIAQPAMAIAVLVTLRFPRWAAWTLLALFAIQFGVPGTGGRLVLTGLHLVLAAVALVTSRRSVLPAPTAPFRRTEQVVGAAAGDARELEPSGSSRRASPEARARPLPPQRLSSGRVPSRSPAVGGPASRRPVRGRRRGRASGRAGHAPRGRP